MWLRERLTITNFCVWFWVFVDSFTPYGWDDGEIRVIVESGCVIFLSLQADAGRNLETGRDRPIPARDS